MAQRSFSLRPWLLATVLAATSLHAQAQTPAASDSWQDARQMVLVITADWTATEGQLARFQRSAADQPWTAVGAPQPIAVGRNGVAWGRGLHALQAEGPRKHEGDGKAPAGVFTLGEAFGYAPSVKTGLKYAAMNGAHYCVDVPASPLYNQIVDERDVGQDAVKGSTEPMRRDLHANGDARYKEGFVIQHNADNVAGAGSCIFAHLWKSPGEPTAGCTAMAATSMDQLLAWLDAKRHPILVQLPMAEYTRLRDGWQLPAMAGVTP